MEKNYVYLFQPKGFCGDPALRVQAPRYAAEISAEGKIGLTRFGFLTETKNFKKADFTALDELTCEFSFYKDGGAHPCVGTRYPYTSEFWYWSAFSKFRIIEAGRYVNKADIMDMVFDDSSLLGRFELCAMPDRFALKFDGYAIERTEGYVEFSLTFPKPWRLVQTECGCRAERGKNFLGISARGASVAVRKNRLVFTGERKVFTRAYQGVTVNFLLNRQRDEKLRVEVVSHNQSSLSVSRNEYGMVEIFSVGCEYLDFNDPAARNAYDRMRVRIENTTDQTVCVPLCMKREGEGIPITGMSPLWRDGVTGEPSGIPVQITKDWHIHPDPAECDEWFAIPLDAPRRYLEGKWSHLYSFITLPPQSTFEEEFVCAFENWGNAPAVSHAQLSLVGWGGYAVWEQLAVGSHGENICFETDTTSQSVSFINDVRPLYTAGRHGGFRSYDWADNIGGGELLTYVNGAGERIEFSEILIDFRAQSPVLTRTDYLMKSGDGKIEGRLTVNLARTDDVLRVYFHIDYRFLQDVEFARLSLFQFDCERYLANLFTRLARGDGDTLLEDIGLQADEVIENGYNSHYPRDRRAGKEPWFYFYGAPERGKFGYDELSESQKNLCDGKNATQLILLRKYEAEINGSRREALFNIRQCYSTDCRHQSVEINPAPAGEVIRAGSKVSMCVEFVTVPSSPERYYGKCDYLLENSDELNTPACALRQVTGNRLHVAAERGKVKQLYPLVLECEQDGCAFTLEGGLGFVPIRFENLSDYRGYMLSRNGVAVDQSVHGNDFWQAEYDEENKTYSLSFSAPNPARGRFELVKRSKEKNNEDTSDRQFAHRSYVAVGMGRRLCDSRIHFSHGGGILRTVRRARI